MVEEWRDINGYKGLYQISNIGRVKSNVKSIIKKPLLKPNGYLSVSLFNNGKEKRFYVHRLVAAAFIENSQGKKDVNHKDGNKQNNVVSNLEWATRSENLLHAHDIGLIERGEGHHSSKLTNEQRKLIKDNYKMGDSDYGSKPLAEKYGVSQSLINMIAEASLPTHGEHNFNAKLKESDVRSIREKYKTGKYTQAQLANMFGASVMAINKIVRMLTWKSVV